MEIRLLRAEPREADFTDDELKKLRARRAAQNARLMAFANGETDAVPLFDFVPLPGSRYLEPVTAENELLERVRSTARIKMDHWAEQTRLRDSFGIIVPEDQLADSVRKQWKSGAAKFIADVQAVLDTGGDLWFDPAFSLFASVNLGLREFGLSLEKLAAEHAAD